MSFKKICQLAEKFEKAAGDGQRFGGEETTHPLDAVEARIEGAISLANEISKYALTKTEAEVPRRMLGLLNKKIAEDLEKAIVSLTFYEERLKRSLK